MKVLIRLIGKQKYDKILNQIQSKNDKIGKKIKKIEKILKKIWKIEKKIKSEKMKKFIPIGQECIMNLSCTLEERISR